MDFLAFASFAVLVIAWLFAPTKAIVVESHSEERAAA
jgi:hypothetical protein